VFFVSLGCCIGQTPAGLFQNGQATGSPTISFASLRHKIPRKALAAFSRALKLARHREWEQGAKELEAAVAEDPDFSDAHGNLGVHYMMLQQLNQAVTEFRRAIMLDRAASTHHSNLALAYLLLHESGEARTEAETAVSLDSRNATGQYLLGCLLAQNPGERREAQKHLSFAAEEIPYAHLALMSLYRSSGEDAKARMELERYRKAISTFKENE